jgi:multicomponent Na+:H+ antiporter subunit A
VPAAVDADVAYDRSLRAVDRLAATVTGRTQVGSLPAYLGVIMTVAVALPGAALYIGHTPWRQPTWLDRGAQLPVVVVIWVAAVLACLTGVRLTAVLLLGAVGYGMSMLYVLHGAPDR